MHPFASLKVVVQPKPVSGSHLGGATNPESHQPGAFPRHCLTAGPWAASGDAPEMGQPGTPATGPSQHGMAEVGRDLRRSSCPAQSRVSNSRTLRAVSRWVLTPYCQCRALGKHTRGATAAVTLCTVLDIVSAAAVVKKWKREKKCLWALAILCRAALLSPLTPSQGNV